MTALRRDDGGRLSVCTLAEAIGVARAGVLWSIFQHGLRNAPPTRIRKSVGYLCQRNRMRDNQHPSVTDGLRTRVQAERRYYSVCLLSSVPICMCARLVCVWFCVP